MKKTRSPHPALVILSDRKDSKDLLLHLFDSANLFVAQSHEWIDFDCLQGWSKARRERNHNQKEGDCKESERVVETHAVEKVNRARECERVVQKQRKACTSRRGLRPFQPIPGEGLRWRCAAARVQQ